MSRNRAGDIVVFRAGDKNYLGRVRAVGQEDGRLSVGRNGEADRQGAVGDTSAGAATVNTICGP